MRRRERSRKYQVLTIIVIGLWLPCQVMAAGIDVFVGYADTIRPAFFFPQPWLGDPGILDVGNARGLIFDAGAIRIDNNTGADLTVDNVTVDGFANGVSFSLWGSFTIPSGMKAILTQTAEEENFDTSDQTSRPCCTPLSFGEEPFPKVRITINGQTMVFSDSAHVLDTKGFDIVDTPPGETNESHQWRLIGTVGGQSVVAVAVPTARDINGDGKADLVWRHADTGDVAVWLLNGTTIAGAEVVGQVSDLRWQIAGGGDVDGDGKADLVWRHAATGDVAVWLLNGTTIVGTAVVTQVADLRWQIAAIGDVDGDGKADLVWRHADTGDVAVWLLNGTTIAGAAVVGQVSDLRWQIAAIGDVDGDGKADLVWRRADTGDVAVWLLNGASLAGGAVVAQITDFSWQIAAIGDVDGDGKADLVWRHTATGEVAVWLLNGASIAGAAVVTQIADLRWQIAAIGDVNGDGKADLVWRHTATGEVAVWLLNGTTIAGAAVVTQVADFDWQIH